MTICKIFSADTLTNAQRLHSDSIYLFKADRIESSISLAVLSIEELGKYFIERWGTKNEASKTKFPTHIEKQAATFLMLHARKIMKLSPKKYKAKLKSGDEKIRDMDKYAEQMQWAKAGFYEDLRKITTYSDKEYRWPEEITDNIHSLDVRELHSFFRKAITASRDIKAMALGAEIYKNGLGDL